ncbi:MotE family protein [uncultured Enterovirga sp.]|uniref:MotE family protein n=1 Tax=uncultured Enterovirga sp. TaxID=2026352 RepID=UPI0035CC993A
MTLGGFLSGRTRLVDGLIIAAGALLLLKGIGFLAAPASPELGPDGLPRFARVLGFARSNYLPVDPSTTGSVPDKPKEPAAPAAPAESPMAAPSSGSPSERSILERLGERREELQQKARDIESREKLLEEAERRLDAKTSEGTTSETKAGPATPAEESEAAALKGLVTMYETMKPKDAARVFERLPHDVLVPVVRLIAPRKMAEIMAAMSSESAEKLTVALARRPGATDARPSASAGLPPNELQAVELPPRASRPRR